jgi:hypothetical protein
MMERTSEKVGRLGDDKKPRLGIATGAERGIPCERENAREMNGEVCTVEVALESAGKELDWRRKCFLAVELNFENEARGACVATARCGLAKLKSVRAIMLKC